ncbi:erythromycin esterase family protein [Paenibacillus sp. 481]|uniref:erythromycin esterase family protein n=1 Tax=Paenibacillus sp. 481 TaxID=2835869 RepID=UPI001E4E08FA|nr:erythromycin esterase family protein [Paenibacillus sp. 481]UHA75595.1 erythromycin esterase family protein [Paenibacillus sp. 481]
MKKNMFKLLLVSMLSLTLSGYSTVKSPSTISDTKAISTQPHIQWLERNAIPLDSSNPSSPLQDLEPLRNTIGSASVVGIGEASHGMHEIFTMKHRVVQFMITEMGFTNLVLELDWETTLKLDHYVLTGEGNPSHYLTPMFNTKEMTDMFHWIRNYNADPAHTKKVRVIGMDNQSAHKNIYDKIINYVKQHKPNLLPELNHKLKELINATKRIEPFMVLPKADKKKYVAIAHHIVKTLEKSQTEGDKQNEQYAWVLQSARILSQLTTTGAAENTPDFFFKHDVAMYENVKWVQENFGKTIVWAHNGHISKTNMIPFVYPEIAGQHLAKHYGDNYVTIGTSVHSGKYNANNSIGKLGMHGTARSDNPKSFNYALGKIKHGQYVIDLRRASGSTKSWLNEKRPLLLGVATVAPHIPLTHDIPLGKTFDILIHVQKVTPSQLNK